MMKLFGGGKRNMNSGGEAKTICAILISVFLGITVISSLGGNTSTNDNHAPNQTEISDNTSSIPIQEPTTIPGTMIDESGKFLIVQGERDYKVIPDKYNTGCSGELEKIDGKTEINGIALAYSDNKLIFDFYYTNKKFSGTVIFENYDFSKYPVVIYHEDQITGRKINFVFKNCKFFSFGNSRLASDTFSYEFYDCSFAKFNGSNASFHNCWFGGTYIDGMVPFNNITVEDCYFSNYASNDPKGNGTHSDGTQIYGYSDAMVQNVLFSNCRFEIPAVQTTKSTAYVNACIMLALEYNNGDNIRFKDCVVNGGGYSIYAGKMEGLTLTNASFENIKIGAAKLYGNIYPKTDKDVVFTNVENQDALYVSSVWNDGSKTHVVVSNDTAEERILRIVTGITTQDFTIKRCAGGDLLRYDNYDMPFEEFPFDIDISVDAKADYVICFDVTDGCENQIRYVSFDGKDTYYSINTKPEQADPTPTEEVSMDFSDMEPISGKCGKNITYYLDNSGILKIEGSGSIYGYNSHNPAPWMEYAELITSIQLTEGITRIGSQAFRALKNVEQINLPKSLTDINSNAFIGCSSLKYISIYSGVTKIEDYAFHGTKLTECKFYGSKDEWENIIIGSYNKPLVSCTKVYMDE